MNARRGGAAEGTAGSKSEPDASRGRYEGGEIGRHSRTTGGGFVRQLRRTDRTPDAIRRPADTLRAVPHGRLGWMA